MALPEERKENLKTAFCKVVDADVLNEQDALAVIQICLDACEREKSAAYEHLLGSGFVDGTDAGIQ